jgi:8-oxo-dGTP pyrophosphatase MutT (NUDIX family)
MAKYSEGTEPAEAAVAIIRTSSPNPEYLLLRRATNPADPWSGHFALPGGRRDVQDADLLETAIREAYEECAIELKRENLVQTLPVAIAGGWLGRPMAVSPFLFEVRERPNLCLQDQEIAEFHWLSLKYLSDPINHSQAPLSRHDPDRLFPCIKVESSLGSGAIWGFTYGVLTSFLELGKRAEDFTA